MSDEQILQPSAPEVEEAILGGMIVEPEVCQEVADMLEPEDFYNPSNRQVFVAARNILRNGGNADLVSVERSLDDDGNLDRVGGAGFLAQLTRQFSAAGNVEYHCRILMEKRMAREAAREGYRVHDALLGGGDPYEEIEKAERRLSDISLRNAAADGRSLRDSIQDLMQEIPNRKESGGVTGIASGLEDFDQQITGFHSGFFYVIAARPGMGKTALVLQMQTNMSNAGVSTANVNLEMSDKELTERLLVQQSGVNNQRLRKGMYNQEEWERLVEASRELSSRDNVVLDGAPMCSIQELRTKVRRWVKQDRCDLLIVDYLQLMTGSRTGKNITREQEISEISGGLKGIAIELDIPVIGLSQLSRAVETRGGDKRPILSDLRESGSLEQDADAVCFLYRPEYYGVTTDENGSSTAGVAEVIVAKQRQGPTGPAKVHFDADTGRFASLSYLNKLGVEDMPPAIEEEEPF